MRMIPLRGAAGCVEALLQRLPFHEMLSFGRCFFASVATEYNKTQQKFSEEMPFRVAFALLGPHNLRPPREALI
jgi:hypothetical protein